MSNCVLCEAEISGDTGTEEHLIPNAIGGRRKIKGFICRKCNSTSGTKWDAELARQLHPLSLMLGICRERGHPPPLKVVTSAGERLTIHHDGKLAPTEPTFKAEPVTTGGITYSVNARSMKEARQIVEGLKRKHPALDVEAVLAQAKKVETYAEGAVHHDLGIGGEVSGRSIVKSMLAMAFNAGIDWRNCQDAVNYLREESAPACFGYHHEKDLVLDRVAGLPLHCVAVKADPADGLILAYAEYFGIHRAVGCLGVDYAGPKLSMCYAIDPCSGTDLPLQVNLEFSRSDIEDIYSYRRVSATAVQQSAALIIGPAIERRNAAEQKRVLSRAVQQAFETCGAQPGELLTEEHVKNLSRSIAESMTPFLLRRMQPTKPRHQD